MNSSNTLYVSQNLRQKPSQNLRRFEHWGRFPDSVLKDKNLGCSAKVVYAFMASCLRSGSVVCVGVRLIASSTGLAANTVTAAIADLAAAGHIVVNQQGKQRSSYHLTSNIFGIEAEEERHRKFSNPALVSKLVEKNEALASQPRSSKSA